MNIPFLDLKAQYKTIREELHYAMQQVIDQTAFAGGAFVDKFDEEFATYCRCSHAAGVSSGTSALHLALLALGIEPGDEIITCTNTFIATTEAISHCGAIPVLVDCDPRTYTIDPNAIEDAITPRTKAIIPVHLFGQMADMDPIMTLAKKHCLVVIEDACQAHGAEYKGRRAGSIGNAGCFSFYPGKNLGAYGDAGAVTSNSKELIDKVCLLRNHGSVRKYEHPVVGWNARMDGIQGAILSVKLKYLDQWNQARLTHAHRYKELLASKLGDALPYESPDTNHVFHVFALRIEERDALIQHLSDQHIGCGVHYPIPIHLQGAYSYLTKGKGSFPVAESCAERFVSLPMFPELTNAQIEYVVEKVLKMV